MYAKDKVQSESENMKIGIFCNSIKKNRKYTGHIYNGKFIEFFIFINIVILRGFRSKLNFWCKRLALIIPY